MSAVQDAVGGDAADGEEGGGGDGSDPGEGLARLLQGCGDGGADALLLAGGEGGFGELAKSTRSMVQRAQCWRWWAILASVEAGSTP